MKKKTLIILITLVAILLIWQLLLRDMKLSGKANLSWNASAESDVTGYNIYYGIEKRKGDCPKDGGYANKVSAGKKNSYQIGNLNDNSTYYFSVTSVNSGGKESCFSEEMSKSIRMSFVDKLKKLFSLK
jgi:hypothetical protein